MPFDTVMFYPQSGWRFRLWDPELDNDALLRTSRAICERYSEKLVTRRIAHRPTSLVITCSEQPEPLPRIAGRFDLRGSRRPSWEAGHVAVPSGFASWELDRRRQEILDALHSICLEMATQAALNREDFEAAKQHTLDHFCQYKWAGPWRTSPGRRWRARCAFSIEPDGYGRTWVEFESLKSGATTVSQTMWAPTVSSSFRRSSKTFRWFTKDSIAYIPVMGKIAPLIGQEHYVGISELETGSLVVSEGPEPRVEGLHIGENDAPAAGGPQT